MDSSSKYALTALPANIIPIVKAHEGFTMNDVNSHTDTYAKAFHASVRLPTEKWVKVDGSVIDLKVAAEEFAQTETLRITDDTSPNGPKPFHPPCNFNYDQKVTFK